MELEKLVISEDSKRADKSMRHSFIITVAILIMAVILFILGKDGAAVVTAIAPILIAFITSSFSRKKDREDKRKQLGV